MQFEKVWNFAKLTICMPGKTQKPWRAPLISACLLPFAKNPQIHSYQLRLAVNVEEFARAWHISLQSLSYLFSYYRTLKERIQSIWARSEVVDEESVKFQRCVYFIKAVKTKRLAHLKLCPFNSNLS